MAMRDLSGAVDFTVLERMTGGDDAVTMEVLDLFMDQTRLWTPLLDVAHEGWRDALHTLRGASAGIGASLLAEVCLQVEGLASSEAAPGLQRVLSALNQALADVAAYRHGLMLRSLSRQD